MQIKMILCPIDFSEFSVRAYRHALSLASHYKARVLALHVVEAWKYPFADYVASQADYAAFFRALQEGGLEQLREFAKDHPAPGIELDLVACTGNAPDSILAFARSRHPDLLVMGTHGRRGFDRLILGSATDRVIRESCCPVLAVCQPPRESVVPGEAGVYLHRLGRILLCADFSEESGYALPYAISVAREYDAELTLFHVVEEVSSPAEEAMETSQRQLAALVSPEQRRGLKVKFAVRSGKPYKQIVEYAGQDQSDLVMMGARGAGALDRAVFGSTTYRVIQLGPCPVLAVPHCLDGPGDNL